MGKGKINSLFVYVSENLPSITGIKKQKCQADLDG